MEDLEDETEETEDAYLYVDFPRDSYKPGEVIDGTVRWKFQEPPGDIDVSLMLEVSNKVQTDPIYPAGFRWSNLPEEGVLNFSFKLPEGPYTYEGKGFQVHWYVEAKCPEFDWTDEAGFTLSPTGKAINLSITQE
jgi:hypothetical protein